MIKGKVEIHTIEGQTAIGKTQLMENMIRESIAEDEIALVKMASRMTNDTEEIIGIIENFASSEINVKEKRMYIDEVDYICRLMEDDKEVIGRFKKVLKGEGVKGNLKIVTTLQRLINIEDKEIREIIEGSTRFQICKRVSEDLRGYREVDKKDELENDKVDILVGILRENGVIRPHVEMLVR